MASASGQPAAMTFKFSRTNHRSFNNNHYFSISPSEQKLVVCFLRKIVNVKIVNNIFNILDTCIQNIKDVVVMDGVCESTLSAILTPAVFLRQRYRPVRPL